MEQEERFLDDGEHNVPEKQITQRMTRVGFEIEIC